MALINGMYIFVEEETTSRSVEISEHKVDKGLPITDCSNRQPATLSLKGIIPNNPDNLEECEIIRHKIVQLMSSGSLVTYMGVNEYVDCLISQFDTGHNAENNLAMTFTMTIQEVLFATSPYSGATVAGKQTVQEAPAPAIEDSSTPQYVIHIVEPGDTIWDLCIKDDAPYKQYGWTVEQVLQENPDCFSTPGDARTMQVGTELAVGYQ